MNRFKVIMAGIIKSIIFGVGFLMTTKSIEQIPVVDFLALRFLIAAICFEILRLTVLKFKLNLKDIISLLPMALCIPIGYYTFEAIGLQGASSMSAGIIISFVPALTFIFEIIFLKERCSLKRGGFILLSVLGVLLIAYMSGGSDKQNTVWGIVFLLFASSMEALYAITSKKASRKLGAPERTYVMMWVGAIVFNAVNIVKKLLTGTLDTYFAPLFDWGSLLCILYMGIVPLIIAFFLYNYMLEREKTSVVTVYIGLETVVAVIAGVLFNAETLYLYHIIGAILIFAGIIGVNMFESSIIKENRFNYKPEEGQNPYIGFMSFQHFRDEKLYSDSIVRPENNYTETEPFECYPVPYDVEENGREEGFYPDTSIAYIRILWKEFEPEQGVYNYKFIKEIINDAKAHNQSLIFRLMPHSTRARDDVPEWLKSIIPCPERPDGMRVKDSPTDPLFLKFFCRAVRKIGEHFDKEDIFYAIDISLPGSWGEGSNLKLYAPEALKELIDTYTDVFKETQLIGQLSKPELINYAGQTVSVGWRGDGLGEPRHTKEYYPPWIEKLKDNWKKAPVSFEAYWWLSEWQRQGWEIDEIIEKTLEWHISSFNAKSLPIPYNWKEKVDYWVSKMGYHYGIDYVRHEKVAKNSFPIDFCIENYGVAPIYRTIPVKIRLKNAENSFEFDTEIDIRQWLPGKTEEKIEIRLKNGIQNGKYDVEIGIFDEINPIIYLCCDAERNGSYYKISEIEINRG